MTHRTRWVAGGAAILAAPLVLHLAPLVAFLLGVAVGGLLPVALLGGRLRTVRGSRPPPGATVRTVRGDVDRRAEELHAARLETERARAQALRERTRPRAIQAEAERRAYIQGAADQVARDQEGAP